MYESMMYESITGGWRDRARWARLLAALGVAAAVLSYPASADQQQTEDSGKTVFGWIEMAQIQPWGVAVKIKMDTGALTSSMQAEHVERFERDGEEWVRFTIEVEGQRREEEVEREFERPLYRNVIIIGAGGRERRPVVLLKLCIGGTVYEQQFSLEDRDNMTYPVLIGRRTIQRLGLVDVTRTFLHEPCCDEDSPVVLEDEHEPDEDIGI